MRIAVIGNSLVNTGFAVAADMRLAGHEVRFSPWPGSEAAVEPIFRRGGIELRGNAAQTASGKLGLAHLMPEANIAAAVRGAELIVLDMLATEFEARFSELLPHLEPGQIVHINSHGYWPALRLAPQLRAAGKASVTLTEAAAPTMAAEQRDGVVYAQWLRRNLPVAVFPASRTAEAMKRLRAAYPTSVVPAANVLETGFSGLNMMIHAAMSVLNIGWFDRAMDSGEVVRFYREGNTPHTGKLAEAQDAERRPICAAYGVPYKPLSRYLRDYYDAEGNSVHEQVRNCAYYQSLSPYPTDVWKRWMGMDTANAHAPFVALADLAGVGAPLHRAVVTMIGGLIGRDIWAESVSLQRLGLVGLDADAVRRYVDNGQA